MKGFVRFAILVVLALVVSVGALIVATEPSRREAAVVAAVSAAKKEAEAEKSAAIKSAVDAAVGKAVADTTKRIEAERPAPPKIDAKLQADAESIALFPDGAYLMEVDGDYRSVTCKDIKDKVHWVRLRTSTSLRAVVERYEPSALRLVLGLLTFGLSAYYGPEQPVQTIFAVETKGRYTTLVLGALRKESDPELVAPQVRLTLYRIDHSNFGVVERAPMDEPPAARPTDKAPAYGQILRRCAYQGGSKDL